MAAVDPLEVAAWRMAVGDLASEDLPGIATDALVRGLDTPALRILAGQPTDDVTESGDLFRIALDELGIDLPDADRAWWQLAMCTASNIVAGHVRPARGANELWRAHDNVRDSGDLRIFVGLASLLDDHPDDAEQIEASIVSAARELLTRPAPRRWIKLMAARERSPLTQTAGHSDVEVDPATLQLSDGLCSDLARWDGYFKTTLSDWPKAGGFDSPHDAERFVAAGRQLVSQLQQELGPTYHVEYMPEPVRPPGVKPRGRQRPASG